MVSVLSQNKIVVVSAIFIQHPPNSAPCSPLHHNFHRNLFHHFLHMRDHADFVAHRLQAVAGVHGTPYVVRI